MTHTVFNIEQTRHPNFERPFLLDCSVAIHLAATLCIGDAHNCCVYRTDWGGGRRALRPASGLPSAAEGGTAIGLGPRTHSISTPQPQYGACQCGLGPNLHPTWRPAPSTHRQALSALIFFLWEGARGATDLDVRDRSPASETAPAGGHVTRGGGGRAGRPRTGGDALRAAAVRHGHAHHCRPALGPTHTFARKAAASPASHFQSAKTPTRLHSTQWQAM